MGSAYTPEDSLLQRYLDFYKESHAHAELSGQEFATTDRIEAELDRLGIEHFRVSQTGTVGILRNGEGPVVAFRADIDGLPVTEDTGLPYSCKDTAQFNGESVGTMHACGHDTHFTSALAAADYLSQHRERWEGTLVLIFQPAEESGDGANAMLAGGLWERAPRPEVLLGQHVMPMPAGQVALRAENQMSLADTLRVTVTGKQAHGSQPDLSVDPIVAVASMVLRLQTIVSRELKPGTAAVVTVSVLRAGTAVNIIPDTASFVLNIRTPDQASRDTVLAAVHRIVDAEAVAARAQVSYETLNQFTRCFNDPEHTARVQALLGQALGADQVHIMPAAVTGSEDVGALADAIGVPLVYWFFGGFGPESFRDGATPAGNHSPHFGPQAESTLRTGISCAATALMGYLGRENLAGSGA
ncbi:amidohydrolase [Galactobacter caseinivorans]|uniref:Amidohydrolase n=2 Tax=Galactobacter caseinivorans TaxID=2676123 RepID=A0A496PJZ3_9MICC|nr:amidohydrolase [Galactobacter caseinivorans]